MQPTKSLPEMKMFDHGGTMAGVYPTENKFAAQHKKLVRMLTVVGYLLCVSLAAILLSLYYLFLWNPDMSKELPEIQTRFTKELCSSSIPFQNQNSKRLVLNNNDSSSSTAHRTDGKSEVIRIISDFKGEPVRATIARQHNSISAPSARRTFVPYPATVARNLLFPTSNFPPVRESLDVSLNPPAYDINVDLHTLGSASSDSQRARSSTESLYDESKRSSSGVSQENSREVITYQDSSALNNINVTSSEY